jgi:glycogen operon protein
MLATLFLSGGVPMLRAGDELSQTQQGNNNAYCQDNEIAWMNWDLDAGEKEFLKFVEELAQFRSAHPVLMRRRFYTGILSPETGLKDLVWYRADGREMTSDDWSNGERRMLAVCLFGNALTELSAIGERLGGETLLVILNSSPKSSGFTLPQIVMSHGWNKLLDTVIGEFLPSPSFHKPGAVIDVSGRSVLVFQAASA